MLLLWTLVFAAYSDSFQSGLVFDNAGVIARDPRIQEATARNVGRIFGEGYWYINPDSGLYRPLTTLSYLVNYSVLGAGVSPGGYHWINLALHEVNVALVYALGLLVFGQPPLALALGALWGVHPLLTESVTNIVGRADLLAAFGVLAGLLCHVRGSAATGRAKYVWLGGLVTAQTIGLFSKESAAVLPGVLLVYDLTLGARGEWRDRVPGYAVLVLPFAAFFGARSTLHTHLVVSFAENPLVGAGFWTGRLTAVKVIGKLLWLFVWPARLSPDYSYNSVPLFGWGAAGWGDAQTLLALAVCVGAVALAIRFWRTHTRLVFFILFFFIALAPTSNLVLIIGSIMAERFMYLPSVALAGCAVMALGPLWERKREAWIGLGVVCLLLAGRTYARNLDWRDDLSLWTSAASICPQGARPHNNLGNALALGGRLSEAVSEFQAALRVRPDYADAHYNLGNALAQMPGRQADAIAEYQAALRCEPDYSKAYAYAKAHNNLGNMLARMTGRLPDAITEYQAAIRSDPGLVEAHYNLASLLAQMPGRLQDAIGEYQATVRLDPDHAQAHNNLGNAFAQMPGRLQDAITEYRAAVRSQPDLAEAHYNLGNALAQVSGGVPAAIVEYQAALRVAPNLAEAHYNLGNLLAQTPGRMADAIAEYEAGLRIKPDPQMLQRLNQLRAAQQGR